MTWEKARKIPQPEGWLGLLGHLGILPRPGLRSWPCVQWTGGPGLRVVNDCGASASARNRLYPDLRVLVSCEWPAALNLSTHRHGLWGASSFSYFGREHVSSGSRQDSKGWGNGGKVAGEPWLCNPPSQHQQEFCVCLGRNGSVRLHQGKCWGLKVLWFSSSSWEWSRGMEAGSLWQWLLLTSAGDSVLGRFISVFFCVCVRSKFPPLRN